MPATPAEPAAQVPEPRGKPGQREEREQRRERQPGEQAITPPPAPARGRVQPEAEPPRATPEAPAVQSREPRDRPEQRGGGLRERERAVAPPPPPAQQPAQRARPEAAPEAEPRGEEPRPAVGKGRKQNKDGEEQKQEDERR